MAAPGGAGGAGGAGALAAAPVAPAAGTTALRGRGPRRVRRPDDPFAGRRGRTAGPAIYRAAAPPTAPPPGPATAIVADPRPPTSPAGDEDRCDGLLFWRISTGAATAPRVPPWRRTAARSPTTRSGGDHGFLRTFEP
ncbi:MAG: hypothetical protein R3F43_02850 [bacterium]